MQESPTVPASEAEPAKAPSSADEAGAALDAASGAAARPKKNAVGRPPTAGGATHEERVKRKYRDYKRKLETLELENLEMVTRLTYLKQAARRIAVERSFVYAKLEQYQKSGAKIPRGELPLLNEDLSRLGEAADDPSGDVSIETLLQAFPPAGAFASPVFAANPAGPAAGAAAAGKRGPKRRGARSGDDAAPGTKKRQRDAAAKGDSAPTDDAALASANDAGNAPNAAGAGPTAAAVVLPAVAPSSTEDDDDEDEEDAFDEAAAALIGEASATPTKRIKQEYDGATSSGKKKKARPVRRAVDPNLPKRPNNAFLNFCNDVRETVKEEMRASGASLTQQPGDITKLLGEKWRTLEPAVKIEYQDAADLALRKWQSEMAALRIAATPMTSSPAGPSSAIVQTAREDMPAAKPPVSPASGGAGVLPAAIAAAARLSQIPLLPGGQPFMVPVVPMAAGAPARFRHNMGGLQDFLQSGSAAGAPSAMAVPAASTAPSVLVVRPVGASHGAAAAPALVPAPPPSYLDATVTAAARAAAAAAVRSHPLPQRSLVNQASTLVADGAADDDELSVRGAPDDDDGYSGPADVNMTNAVPVTDAAADAQELDALRAASAAAGGEPVDPNSGL